ncbi:hypothetical protein GQF03_17460 [Sneathiella chungangensis]|uniref:Lipoprotein n=1 Tax=Sneathiella chungangensis TaxID=1418234 RepID=A0A845MKH1_9PROT|nr:hypothetical protein [Sneathiella chungangensis]MZR24125.1 hypothetical protein [Sneathiella chungangensis]
MRYTSIAITALILSACNTTPVDTSIPTAAGTAYDGVWSGGMGKGTGTSCHDVEIETTITNGHASGDIAINNNGHVITDSFVGNLNKNGELVPELRKYPADVSGVIQFHKDGTTTGKMETTVCSTDRINLKRT